jgi:hypothetical protein
MAYHVGSAEVVAPKKNNKSIVKTCLFVKDLVQKNETLQPLQNFREKSS